MKYLSKLLLMVVMLLFFTQIACAQQDDGIAGCRGGVCNGWQWQPGGPQGPPIPAAPPPPPQIWVDHWGAITYGYHPKGTIVGASKDQTSEQAAKNVAVQDCVNAGGGGCKTVLVYRNQCVAVVEGEAGLNGARALTIAEATQVACSDPSRIHGKCHAVYTACSLPVRIQ